MFADLHCHPQARSYNWLSGLFHKHQVKKRKNKMFHPWTIVLSNRKQQAKGGMAAAYGQCDMAKLWNGEVRLVFASLYPMEKGFFSGTKQISKSLVAKISQVISGDQGSVNRKLFGLLHNILPKIFKRPTLVRNLAQATFMRLPYRRLLYFQQPDYDYFEELKKEYRFTTKKSGVHKHTTIHTPFLKTIFKNEKRLRDKHPEDLDAKGTYVVCKNAYEIEETIDHHKIAFVLTIEGAHCFDTDTKTIGEVLDRVMEVKNWKFPVFFITFAHHFNNHLCGHAHSLPDVSRVLFDQREGMNTGFNENGWKVIRKLLSLDENNDIDQEAGRRIHIDVKHMSAKSRKQYYEEIVKPCLDKGDSIPVIASHCGYAGLKTLDDMIQNPGREKDDFKPKGFYGWNINLCDEDVKIIFKTSGLFGLSFDQRILGGDNKSIEEHREQGIHLIWKNIEAVLNIIKNDTNIRVYEKSFFWDMLCIGTDFEGYINPVSEYPTVLTFENFKRDLTLLLEHKIKEEGRHALLIPDHADAKEVVDKICFKNAYTFVLKHFHDMNQSYSLAA